MFFHRLFPHGGAVLYLYNKLSSAFCSIQLYGVLNVLYENILKKYD